MFSRSTSQSYSERDPGSSLETPRDENYGGHENYDDRVPDTPAKSSKISTVRRSFSFGKKKKKQLQDRQAERAPTISSEARTITIDRVQADCALGFEMHCITGDVMVSYVDESYLPGGELAVGDCVLAIQGLNLVDGGSDAVEAARYILREPADVVEIVTQRHCVRTEVLTRVAALRGTSLDKLGLTLSEDVGHIIVCAIDGLALKSKRIVVGDRVIAINGRRCHKLPAALELLAAAYEESSSIEFDLVYGFVPPANHEFDVESGLFLPLPEKPKGSGVGGIVKRSLSFGKSKKKSKDDLTSSTPRMSATAQAPAADAEPPPLNLEPRLLKIPKNAEGMIQVTFKAHATTNELIIGLVGDGSPAQAAGVEIGDAVLALQGNMIECDGEFALDDARAILQQSSHHDSVELMVQTKLRTEVIEFSCKEVGAPRNFLGLSFHSFDGDTAVRITGMAGPAAKSGRIALGDRITAVNGIRVNHAQTLSDHIAHIARTDDYVTFEVALGYAPGEGLWYGSDADPSASTPRKAKRSFSFGRKPKH